MSTNEQTTQQIDRFINKVAKKFPQSEECTVLTDIHLRVSPETGELTAFDDDENEITRCVVEQWIANTNEQFYESCAQDLRDALRKQDSVIDSIGILKPFSFLLESDDHEHLAELYLVSEEEVIIGGDIMPNIGKELDDFFDELLK